MIQSIKSLNPLPRNIDKEVSAITSWANYDEAFSQVSKEISLLSEIIQQKRREHKRQNIVAYEDALYSALKQERPLRSKTKEKLNRLRKNLDLDDSDIAFSESFMNTKATDDSANEEKYREEVRRNIQDDRGEISKISRILLDQQRESLGISKEISRAIENEELKYPKKYERVFYAIYSIEYALGKSAKHRLKLIAKKLGLNQDGLVEDIQNRILERLNISRDELQFVINSKLIPKDLLLKNIDQVVESEINLNYARLRLALEARNWRLADQETYNIFLDFARNHKKCERITSALLLDFPSLDLKTIDTLWRTYSEGHFGFSSQIEIYKQCGASRVHLTFVRLILRIAH